MGEGAGAVGGAAWCGKVTGAGAGAGAERGIGGGHAFGGGEAAGVLERDMIGFTPKGVAPGAGAADVALAET